MKRRTSIFLNIIAGLFVVGGLVAWQWRPLFRAYYNHRVHTVTTSLPGCDRVEVFHLAGEMSESGSGDFPNRKTLIGVDAESLAALWRSQKFGWEYQAMCHEPAYGFRFYRGSSLKFETSVCFHCSNFYVTALWQSGWYGFDNRAQSATNLLTRLQEIFPASIPKQKEKTPAEGAAVNAVEALNHDAQLFHPWGWEDPMDARAHLDGYKHVLVAQIDEHSWENLGANRLTPHHFKATVISTYKGDWSV